MNHATLSTHPIGLIGGIGLTEVHVYAQRRGDDGLFAGCPHVHAVVDEGYYVLRGTGHVEFHDPRHGMRTLRLTAGDYAHFPPLVMHRLVSDGDLAILGMMGSAGLAERGEARIYFGREVDENPDEFARLVSLPRREGLEGALQRRDAATRAYMRLLALMRRDHDAYLAELRRFIAVHRRAMSAKADEFRRVVQQGPIAWAEQTLARLQSSHDAAGLLSNDLNQTDQIQLNRQGTESAFGMCGVLRPMLSLTALDNAGE